MRRHELQYISDTILIESLASDPALLKQAGLFEDLGFSSIASAIKGFLGEYINKDAPGGYVGGALNMLTPGILWKVHPVLGAASVANSLFGLGFDLGTIYDKVRQAVSSKISTGKKLTMGEADAIAKGAVGLKSTASIPLGDLIAQGRWRSRRWRGFSTKPDIPFGRDKGAPLLRRVFGNLGKLRGRMLFAGILIWFIKTFLLAAGLIAGGAAIYSLVSDKDKKQAPRAVTQQQQPAQQRTVAPAPGATYKQQPAAKTVRYTLAPAIADPFESSGRGEKFFTNDLNSVWVVPLINRSINETLRQWTMDIYPETELWKNLIDKPDSFKRAVRRLKTQYSRKTPNSLIMPREFHTRKQVVDLFARDIAAAIKGKK